MFVAELRKAAKSAKWVRLPRPHRVQTTDKKSVVSTCPAVLPKRCQLTAALGSFRLKSGKPVANHFSIYVVQIHVSPSRLWVHRAGIEPATQ